MNEQLLTLCGDKIEILYQRRRGVPAEVAWQRLHEELTLISGTEAEQRFLVAAEIAKICCRHYWPVWEAGTGPSSIILFLLEISQADPIENGLLFQRYFFAEKNRASGLLLKTLDQYVEPLGQAIATAGASSWIRIGSTTRLEAIPYLVEEDLGRRDKAPDWGREPTDRPSIWEFADSRFTYQLQQADVLEAREAWQPGSPAQFAGITAIAHQAAIDGLDPFTWAQREETTSVLLQPWVRETGGVLIFQEQIMKVLHELAGFELAPAWRVVGEMAKHNTPQIGNIEKQFLQGAVERGHDKSQAWTAFDNIRHAGMRGLHCKAYHVAHAVTTYRALWLKTMHTRTYQLYAPPEVDSQQAE